MRAGVRSPTASRDDGRHEPVLDRVDGGGADAAAGGDADDDDRVHIRARRVEASVVPKKALAYCLTRTSSPSRGATSGMISSIASSPINCRSAGDLAEEQAPVDPVRPVHDTGVDHRHAASAGGVDHAAGRVQESGCRQVELARSVEVGRASGRWTARPAARRARVAAEPAIERRHTSRPAHPGPAASAPAGRSLRGSRSRMVSIGGPMLNVGRVAGRAAASSLAQPLRSRSRPRRRHRRRRPRSGARLPPSTRPRRTSRPPVPGSRASGSPQPPPPQVTKCSTSPALTGTSMDLAGQDLGRCRRPGRSICGRVRRALRR